MDLRICLFLLDTCLLVKGSFDILIQLKNIPEMQLKFKILNKVFGFYLVNKTDNLLMILNDTEFYSITASQQNFSVISQVGLIQNFLEKDEGWKALQLQGNFDLDKTSQIKGIIATFSKPIADSNIKMLVVSDYKTDYLFVKEDDLDKAVKSLQENEIEIIN